MNRPGTELYASLMALEAQMVTRYHAVHPVRNPVAAYMKAYSADRVLVSCLIQYCHFPAKIVEVLSLARSTLASTLPACTGALEIDAELDRNIGQELGSDTKGVSHYDMLRTGILDISGIAVDEVPPSAATSEFLTTITAACDASKTGASAALGAVYGLEASAVPELLIVRRLVESLAFPLPPVLDEFFFKHTETWEPSHRDNLRVGLETLHGDNLLSLDRFGHGFRSVLAAMDTWWDNILQDSVDELRIAS